MTPSEPNNTSELQQTYQTNGFLHVPQMLDPTEVELYRQALDKAVCARKQDDTRPLREKSLYEQSFIQCQYLWEEFVGVRPLTFHPKITAMAANLMNATRIRLWHDQALYKEAGGRETEAHQDQPYWPIAERDTITAWIALVDTNENNGCMAYFPGSHFGDAEFIDIFNTPGDGKRLEEKLQATPPVFVPCRAGDVVFHNGFTVHMANANNSGKIRKAYTMIFFKDGCTRRGDLHHPSVYRDNIQEGDVIAGGATPVAWPLFNNQLPEPTPWPALNTPRSQRAQAMGVIPKT